MILEDREGQRERERSLLTINKRLKVGKYNTLRIRVVGHKSNPRGFLSRGEMNICEDSGRRTKVEGILSFGRRTKVEGILSFCWREDQFPKGRALVPSPNSPVP
jgi:hypothetical protein